MSWLNLFNAVYPIGSVYLSTTAISPANLIGGTWTQVEGAVLAATGANDFAGAASYGGDLAISIEQMPAHSHEAGWSKQDGNNGYIRLGGNLYTSNTGSIASIGGGQTFCPTTGAVISGSESPNCFYRGDVA